MDETLITALEWRQRGRRVALATVLETWGSAPRPAGSFMAVDDAGSFVGSVSGGCVETSVVSEARQLIEGGESRVLEFGVADEEAWAVGLPCGGRIRVGLERLDGDVAELARLAVEECAAGRPVVLVADPASGEHRWLLSPGDESSTLMESTADSEELPAGILDTATQLARLDRSGTERDGNDEYFLHTLSPPLRMIVVGAVHIAQALAPMARQAGFEVTVVDPRRAFASAERFPEVEVRDAWPDEALEALRPDARTAVVVLAHDPKLDDPALIAALRSRAYYIGALGSGRTQRARRQRLREAGFDDADLDRIHGPVGLDLGGRAPAEIAVATLAEAIAVLRRPGSSS